MNKKRLFLLGAISLLMVGLGGCQLAKADGTESGQDQLIGVFITYEYLDLFDFDRYLEDNISSIMKGRREIGPRDQEKYGGRIYAELEPMAYTNPKSGETIYHSEYVFEGLKGVPFFHARIMEPGAEPYSVISSGPVSEVHQTIGDSTEIEGTIYVAPGGPQQFYPNPVYQSLDGRVYLAPGTGISGALVDQGTEYTQSFEEKQTITENDEKTEKVFRVTIRFAGKFPASTVDLIQMSRENMPFSCRQYGVQDLPEEIEIGGKAAYLIVEIRGKQPGGETINRELINRGDEYLTIYTANDEGICVAKTVSLSWGE